MQGKRQKFGGLCESHWSSTEKERGSERERGRERGERERREKEETAPYLDLKKSTLRNKPFLVLKAKMIKGRKKINAKCQLEVHFKCPFDNSKGRDYKEFSMFYVN